MLVADRTVEYPISPRYIPNWTVSDALRELIANALDTKTASTFMWQLGKGLIQDSASGIPQKYWVFGEGVGGAIGQFHEGLKLAMLVLAREGVPVKVETVGYTVVPSIGQSEVFQSDVLQLTYIPNNVANGTTIAIEVGEKEFLEARNRFLIFKQPPVVSPHGVFDAPGQLWINGVFVQTVEGVFGYNIEDKSLTNRDRSVLDSSKLRNAIGKLLSMLTKAEHVAKILAADKNSSMIEWASYLYHPTTETSKKAWADGFRKAFGRKACIGGGAFDDVVRLRGWKVVDFLPMAFDGVLKDCGIETSREVANRLNTAKFDWPQTALTELEQAILDEAKRIAKLVVPNADVGQTHVVEGFTEFENESECCVEGMYRKGNVYIKRICLVDLAKATGVLIHERLHGLGYRDGSMQFESALTEVIGALAVEAKGKK